MFGEQPEESLKVIRDYFDSQKDHNVFNTVLEMDGIVTDSH